ncbi:hypothetical protein WI697_24280 [Tistrella mobilis]|uniref:hypothetical protein n=3 Tax=Tistrella mobilis TaxID=171437 RepID=UPI0031F70E6D
MSQSLFGDDLPDLSTVRLAAGLSEAALAYSVNGILGEDWLSADQVAVIERRDPAGEGLTRRQHRAWYQACGYGDKMPPLDLGNPYAPLLHRRETIIAQVLGWPDPAFGEEDAQAGFDKAGILAAMAMWVRLPRLLVSGGFDAGKTFLCKALIGDPPHEQGGLLRSNYAPETRMITVIIHVDHRPPWLTQPVALMSAAFDLDRLYDRRHVEAELILAGDRALIERFAVHRKERPGGAATDQPWASDGGGSTADADTRVAENAAYCLVFMAAPLLRSLILIDPPGFDSGMVLDQERARKMAGLADIVVFLSQFVGFLNVRDFSLLAEQLRALQLYPRRVYPGMGAFRNLFVVATHARQSPADIDHVLSEGARRLWADSERSSKLFQRRAAEAGEADGAPARLLERFFAFYPNYPFAREPLQEDLADLLAGPFPRAFNRQAKTVTERILESARQYYARRVTRFDDLLSGRFRPADEVRAAEAARDEVDRSIVDHRRRMEAIIAEARRAGLEAANNVTDELYDPVRTEQMLRSNFERYDDAQRHLSAFITETIHGRLEDALNQPLQSYQSLVLGFARKVVSVDLSKASVDVDIAQNDLLTRLATVFFNNAPTTRAILQAISPRRDPALFFNLLWPVAPTVAAALAMMSIGNYVTRWPDLAKAVVGKLRDTNLRVALTEGVEATCASLRKEFDTLTAKARADRLADLARKQHRARQSGDEAMACFQRDRACAETNRRRIETLQRTLRDSDR